MNTIAQELQQRIDDKTLDLPMLPQVISQVLALVNDPESDAAALATLIQSDQALAGHVMRIANSAAYSPNTQMTSLQQAIARLGMQSMTEIALAATMGPALFSAKGFETLVKQLWQSSLATAVWAKEVARHARKNVESAFLCGLLFQIGKPVVLQTALGISHIHGLSLSEEEVRQLMNEYYAHIGVTLAEQWQLPASVTQTIKALSPRTESNFTIDPANQSTISCVRAAIVFASYEVDNVEYDEQAIIEHTDIIDINLYAEDVQQLLKKSALIKDAIGALSL